jgi:hypothetical protein
LVEQMEIVAINAKAALAAVGATPHDIVMARVYIVDLTPERLEAMMPPFLAAFDGAQPCVTGIGVAALAAPNLQVEMELVSGCQIEFPARRAAIRFLQSIVSIAGGRRHSPARSHTEAASVRLRESLRRNPRG